MNKTIKPPKTGYLRFGPATIEQTPGGGIKPCNGRPYEDFESKSHADQYDAQQRAEAVRAVEAARTAARDRARAEAAKQPKPCGGIPQAPIRRDPDRIAEVRDQSGDEWRQFISTDHIGVSPREVLEGLGFTADSMVNIRPGGLAKLGDVLSKLDTAEKLDPNEWAVNPTRKFLVGRFNGLVYAAKVTDHLKRLAAPAAIVADGNNDRAEIWWPTTAMAQRDLTTFCKEITLLGSEGTLRSDFIAVMPAAVRSKEPQPNYSEKVLTEIGVSLSKPLAQKNHVLFFAPPNKSVLPVVPPLGRSV
jgi:hypothetical protein